MDDGSQGPLRRDDKRDPMAMHETGRPMVNHQLASFQSVHVHDHPLVFRDVLGVFRHVGQDGHGFVLHFDDPLDEFIRQDLGGLVVSPHVRHCGGVWDKVPRPLLRALSLYIYGGGRCQAEISCRVNEPSTQCFPFGVQGVFVARRRPWSGTSSPSI